MCGVIVKLDSFVIIYYINCTNINIKIFVLFLKPPYVNIILDGTINLSRDFIYSLKGGKV
jgi:hypothetical protein